jgi:hypothetical protein
MPSVIEEFIVKSTLEQFEIEITGNTKEISTHFDWCKIPPD